MSYRNCFFRKGLTLLELVVVLVILVALASILVPLLPGMLGKAHTSTHTTNIVEINKLWETIHVARQAYPDGLDSLVTGAAGDVYSKLPKPTTSSPYSADTPLSEDEVTSLADVGIKNVYYMDEASTDATFNPYNALSPTARPLKTGDKICRVTDVEVNRVLGAPLGTTGSPHTYVVFGIGSKCSAVGSGSGGTSMITAPVHFSDEANADPRTAYSRCGVVFDVADAGQPARFVGAVGLHADGLSGAEEGLREWYENR